MTRTGGLVLLGCLLVNVAGRAQEIQFVTVTGGWGGLGTPANSKLTLRRSGDSSKEGGADIRPGSLDRLKQAMQEPTIIQPSAGNLGIDGAWLRAHTEVAGKNASMLWFDQGTSAQKAFFTARFTDISTIQERLNVVYKGFHTDDYPGMKIELHFSDGTSLDATSHSQNPLMLPWCVGSGNQCTDTYNADISQALYVLLPKNFTNRERLHDDDNFGGLAPQMGLDMSSSLEREWNMIGVREKDPLALGELQKHFTVRYADINTWNDLAFNEVPNKGKTVDENLQVILWRPGFPQDFVIEAHLLRKNSVTQGVAELAAKANHYADSVLAVDWLREFFQTHPKEGAFVTYVHGVSMTDKAMRIFSQDMKATRHVDLVSRVRAVQSDAVLLTTGSGDKWIVLPDHSMILWRWASLHPILKWPKGTFPAKECSDYGMVTGGCDGTVISPAGDIGH